MNITKQQHIEPEEMLMLSMDETMISICLNLRAQTSLFTTVDKLGRDFEHYWGRLRQLYHPTRFCLLGYDVIMHTYTYEQ